MCGSRCRRPGSPSTEPCEAPAAVLTGDGRRSVKDAEAAAGRAGVCDLLPGVHDALAGGDVSAGHADALARVARDLDDTGRSQLQELEADAGRVGDHVQRGSVRTGDAGPGADPGRVMTGSPTINGCGGNARCAGGWTATPGCATPICSWTPKPTPKCPPPWTRRSPPNEPSPTTTSAELRPVESRRHGRLGHRRPDARSAGARGVRAHRSGHVAHRVARRTASVRPVTANRCHRPRCAACAVKRRSCRWC